MQLVPEQPLDMVASLDSGQAHRWKREDGWHTSVVQGNYIKIRQTDKYIEYHCAPNSEESILPLMRSYFRMDDDLDDVYSEITRDDRVATMVDRYPGLRILRQEPWECFIAFITSANSNIPRIHQGMEKMAASYGSPIYMDGSVRHAFPNPEQLAGAGEMGLRHLGLGFRAPYVDQAAQLVAEGRLNLDVLVDLPYEDAKAKLMECKGIGPKIADCIAVFSLDKLEAFPIDVWVRRALGDWYFPGEKPPPDRVLLEWAQGYFGQYCGYAQQYLFHGRRLEK